MNLANGNLVVHSSELSVNSPGLNLKLDRFFNSQATGSGAFGSHGVLSTGQDVGLQINANSVVFFGPSGFTATFTGTGPSYTSPAGINATLVQNGNSTYSLTYNKSGEKLSFSSGGYLTADADRNGNSISLGYNADQTLSSITDTAGRVTTFGYTSGRLTSITDPASRATAYAYTGANLTRSTNADGNSTTYTYNSSNQLTRIQTPAGRYTDFGYDSSGRITSVKRYLTTGSLTGGSVTTTFGYPSATSTTETDPAGHVTTYTLDSLGRVTAVMNPLGKTKSVTWTPNSDLSTAIDAMGSGGTGANTTTYSYDSNNNLTAVASPTGAAARAQYANTTGTNACSTSDSSHPYLAKCTEDAQGDQSSMTYDARGNMISVTDTSSSTPNSGVSKTYTYDGDGSTSCSTAAALVCTSTTGNGNTTTYAYGTNSTLTSVTPPTGPATTYTYDSLSRLTTVTDPIGVTISYTYDARDQRTKTAYSTSGNTGETITTTFNADGGVTSTVDSVNGEEDYTYDGLGRELTDAPPKVSTTPTVTYNSAGDVASYADAAGTVTYGYNAANEVTSLAEPGGSCTGTVSACTTYSYNADGAQTGISYPGGTTQTTTVDAAGRPTEIKAATSAATISDLAYSYTTTAGSDTEVVQTRTDKVGVGAPAGSVTTYTYDSLARLTGAVEKTAAGATIETWAYRYDKDGNRTTSSDTRATGPAITAQVTANSDGSNAALTSPAFSTPTGSNQLLIALVSGDGPMNVAQTDTVTGAGLSWTLVQRANNASDTGTAEIWKATPTGALSNVTVTATQAKTRYSQTLTVQAFTGTSGVGATSAASAATGAPATALTTTAAGSLITGAGNDGYSTTARTPNTGQRVVHELPDTRQSATDDQWAQTTPQPVTAAGTAVTFGDSAPTSSTFNIAAAEIKPATGGSTLTQTAAYNALDELTTLNGSTTGLSYDADGNETANPATATSPGSNYTQTTGRTETYNQRDQQTGINPAGADPLTNNYLGDTNTTLTATTDTTTATTTTYLNTMLGLTADTATGTREYVRTPSGQLAATHTSTGSSYYLTDNIGSTVATVDNTGHTQTSYSYDPVGNTRTTTGNPTLTPIRYAAGLYNPTTGLTKYGARTYDPNTARFTQPDPSGQEDNPYAYAGDNPINAIDPAGLKFLNISVSACFGICVSAGVDISSDGVTPTVGVGAGPDGGVDVSATESGGSPEQGTTVGGSCTAGGVEAGADTNGDDLGTDAGVTTGTDVGCEADATYTG